MTKKFLAMTLFALMCVAWSGSAHADLMGTDYIITNYNTSFSAGGGYGGVFASSGNLVSGPVNPFVDNYCIMLYKDIYANTNYNFTYNTAGYVDNQLVQNAGEIAYLMVNYAPAADLGVDSNGNTGLNPLYLQFALQSAIWHLAGIGGAFDMSGYPAIVQQYYSDYLAHGAGNSAPLNSLIWISPYNGNASAGNASTWVQAQIALVPPGLNVGHVPEPSSLALLGLGGIGLAVAAYRRRRAAR